MSSGILPVCWVPGEGGEGGLGSSDARGAVGAAPACCYESDYVWGVEENNSSVKGTCLKTSILLNGFALLIHCCSAGSLVFPLLINMHKHLHGIMYLAGKKKEREEAAQLDVLIREKKTAQRKRVPLW